MLKEIDITDIPDRREFGCAPTPTSIFCEKTLGDFMASPVTTAEVVGWSDGQPRNCKKASSYASAMQSKIKHMKLDNVQCVMRGKRIFIMKTIVRKVDDYG